MSDRQAKKARKSQRDGLSLRNGVWQFRRIVKGKRVMVSTRCRDRDQARRRKTEIEKDQNDGTFGWKKKPEVLVPLLSTYLLQGPPVQHAKNVGGSASSWALYFQRLCDMFPGRRLDELTVSDCDNFIGERKRMGDTENYLRTQFIVYRATWNRAMADGVITANPWSEAKEPKIIPRERILLYEEEPHLFEALSPSVARAARLVLGSGVRNAELCGLERRDVDFLRGRLTIRAEIAKNKKQRVIPLPPDAIVAIKEQLHDLDYGGLAVQFPSFKEDDPRIFPYAKTSLVHSFSGFVQGLNMPSLTIHDLRRTYGTRHAENGVPMRVLQKWMGHSKITITAQFYTNVDEQRVDFLAASLKASEQALAAATVLEFKQAM